MLGVLFRNGYSELTPVRVEVDGGGMDQGQDQVMLLTESVCRCVYFLFPDERRKFISYSSIIQELFFRIYDFP